LDEDRIPPDLYQAFSAVRDYTLAQLMVKVNPPESSVILIDPEYGFKTSPTDPARFNKLLPNEYQLVVTKKGYQEERFTIELKAGEKDTIAVELQPKPSILKNVKKYWPWGGGVAIVTTLLIYGLSGGDDAQTDGRELPLPPSRP
jgi:hypothetical protein